MIAIALLGNVFSIWPQIFNLASIEFISVSRELSQNEDVQLYKESIVVVSDGNSKGTGFHISEDGHILTNQHVVDGRSSVVVTFEGGDMYHAEVVRTYDDIDIALLKMETDDSDHPVLDFEESWEPSEQVYFIGNPLFFNYIANKGNILDLTPDRDIPMLMVDAPIYKGNSGSPVINEDGNVIAVIYATSRVDYEGSRKRVGLAVPVEYFIEDMEFTDDL